MFLVFPGFIISIWCSFRSMQSRRQEDTTPGERMIGYLFHGLTLAMILATARLVCGQTSPRALAE